jgi:hypothetical protein
MPADSPVWRVIRSASRQPPHLLRLGLAAAACLVLLASASLDADAGEAQAGFTVTVDYRRTQPVDACSLSSDNEAVRIACTAPTALLTGNTPRVAAVVSRPTPSVDPNSVVDTLRTGGGERVPADVLAAPRSTDDGRSREEEFVKAYLTLLVDPGVRVQSPTRFGEYSSRMVVVGENEYVEMTISW